MIRHLLWKDVVTLKLLFVAVSISIFVAAVCLVIVSMADRDSSYSNHFASCWLLMPNLLALGAPAILVGSEEEQGSLSWLKTLPVRWQSIADSKLLIALRGLLAA